MKRIPKCRHLILVERDKNVLEAKLRRSRRGRRRVKGARPKQLGQPKTLVAPVVIQICANIGDPSLLNFIDRIYREILEYRSQVTLDFSATERIHAEGMALLLAELHRIKRLAPMYKPLSLIQPKSEKVQQVFKQVGVYELLGIKLDLVLTEEDVIHWRVATGRRTEGEKVPGVLGKVEGSLAEPLKKGLFAGITEAMTNVCHHAYIEERGDGHDHHPELAWWMFSQLRGDYLSVVICDLGVGISRSLPISHKDDTKLMRVLQRLAGKMHFDRRAIREALKLGVTRVDQIGRGYGFYRNIGPVIEKAGEGDLIVISNRGFHIVSHASDGRRSERSETLAKSIRGTIISWRVPVSQVKD